MTVTKRRLNCLGQALLPAQYARMMDELRQLAEVMGKTIDVPEGISV